MGWIIFFSILLILAIALAMSVQVEIKLCDEVRIKVKYAWLTILSISPEAKEKKKIKKAGRRKKAKAAAKDKNTNSLEDSSAEKNDDIKDEAVQNGDDKEKQQDDKEKKQKMPLSERIDSIKPLIESAGKPARRLFKHIRIYVRDADITVSGKDAASAALNYGRISWVIYNALNLVYEFFTLNIKRINIGVDFDSGKFKYILNCNIKLRLSTAIGCALWFAFRYLKMILKNKSKLSGAHKRTASGKGN